MPGRVPMNAGPLLAFSVYAFVTSITPGPNNAMLFASGVNFGFMRTIPHILGVSLGFAVMLLAIGFGLGELFRQYPALYAIFRWIGAAYLVWLAWKIACSGPAEDSAVASRPFSFLQAAGFQWVNPKCWVVAIGALTTYMPPDGGLSQVGIIAPLFTVISVPCVGSWASFGVALRRWLADPRINRVFNVGMATLLVASIVPLFTEGTH